MADISNYTFTGRLGQDAQVKQTPNGKTYMEMSCAVNTGYGDYKKTTWVKVKQWGERVNNIVSLFTQGALIGASGEVSVNSWIDKNGAAHADLEVTCMSINLLASKRKAEDPAPENDEDVVF